MSVVGRRSNCDYFGAVRQLKPLRILSWNILHGGGTRCEQILSYIEKHDPDIVTLQEFRHGRSKPVLLDGLKSLGLDTVFAPETTSARDNSLVIATRLPMQSKSFPDDTVPARAISASIEVSPMVDINLIAVHFPQKKAQLPLFNALLDLPSQWLDGHSILLGDFNCGIPLVDSETKTFYATHMFQQLLSDGWHDAWRERHPLAREYTWVSTRKSNGFRYDHALASKELNDVILNVDYDHEARETKASDHSLMIIDIDC